MVCLCPAQHHPSFVLDRGGADEDSGEVWFGALAFRFHVSMCGVLGVGGHLEHWSAEERGETAR